MAPKAELIEKPVSSSSEEEENESGSSAEESGESSGEEVSSDEEGVNLTKLVQASVAGKKPEADSEDESGSDSDSDEKPAPAAKNKRMKNKTEKTLVAKPRLETTKLGKRNQADDVVEVEDKKNKRMKTSAAVKHAKKKPETSAEEESHKAGEETKKPQFQRIFSEEDELALLQAILDFTATKRDPSEHVDVYCESLKKVINVDANKAQLLAKVKRLKKRFDNMVKKNLTNGKSEEENAFSKPYEQTFFELSKKIWGINGALVSKSKKKKTGEKPKEIELPKSSKKKGAETDVVQCTPLSYSEIASFFTAETAASVGLAESSVLKLWEKVDNASKKREIEERLKKIKRAQELQSLTRIELVNDVAVMMLKDNA